MSEPPAKRHKKHKRDRDRDRDRYDENKFGGGTPTYSSGGPSAGNARLKLILKVGGSSTPEHSDSPGPAHVLSVPYDEDSRTSSTSYPHVKKSKKKEKKKKKDKKHKHHHKEKKRKVKNILLQDSPLSIGSSKFQTSAPQLVSPLTLVGKGFGQFGAVGHSENSEVLENIGSPSTSKESRSCVLKQKTDKQPLQKLLEHLHRALEKKDPQQFFAWPVTDKIAPGYSSIITKPMDFSSIKAKVDTGEYNTYHEFVDDFKLMCNNAMTYNQAETVYYKAAKKLLQSGLKLLDPMKIRDLVPVIPSIRMLSEEQFPFPIFHELTNQDATGADMMSQSEEEIQEPICTDPTKSIHYVPPHPNDPPDPCGAFTEDLVMEEVLIQARMAAREASHRLTTKRPNSKLGFLRQKEDGTTSLAILTSGSASVSGEKEQPISLGALTGKIPHGTAHLVGKEEKKLQRGPKTLHYGPFSSYAPSHDSTFAGLTKDESELVEATYGDDTASQYAESIFEFAKGTCDYAMRMVDEILNTLTKGEHSRTIDTIQERKRIQEEEALARRKEEEVAAGIEEDWGIIEMGLPGPAAGAPEFPLETIPNGNNESVPLQNGVDIESLKSLGELGIDTGFLDSFDNSVNRKLNENAELIQSLEKAQNDRLKLPVLPTPPYVHPIQPDEVHLAERITENLIDLAKQTVPGSLISTSTLHKVMGIDVHAFPYKPPPPRPTPTPGASSSVMPTTTDVDRSPGQGDKNGNGIAGDDSNASLPTPQPEPQVFENVQMDVDPSPSDVNTLGVGSTGAQSAIVSTTGSSSTDFTSTTSTNAGI